MAELLKIQNLKFSYPSSDKVVLRLDSLSLGAGEKLFIRGRSGSGKSTFLNLISGVLKAPEGCIHFEGNDLATLGSSQMNSLRAQFMGVIFQQFNLLPFMSAFENVCLPSLFLKKDALLSKGLASAETRLERATLLFEHLKLAKDLLHAPVRELSVGQQQRVAVVRSLMFKPKLILADEPTSSLDHEVRDSFIDLLNRESKEIGASVLFVSHDPQLESFFDRSVHLNGGAS